MGVNQAKAIHVVTENEEEQCNEEETEKGGEARGRTEYNMQVAELQESAASGVGIDQAKNNEKKGEENSRNQESREKVRMEGAEQVGEIPKNQLTNGGNQGKEDQRQMGILGKATQQQRGKEAKWSINKNGLGPKKVGQVLGGIRLFQEGEPTKKCPSNANYEEEKSYSCTKGPSKGNTRLPTYTGYGSKEMMQQEKDTEIEGAKTIRELLREKFGKRNEANTEQRKIEHMEVTVAENREETQSESIWNYRKQNIEEVGKKKARKTQVHRDGKGSFYLVELASEDDEEQEQQHRRENTENWEIELANKMQYKLNIKRKRDSIERLTILDSDETKMEQQTMITRSKRSKVEYKTEGKNTRELTIRGDHSNFSFDMAEEAGRHMPHLEP
ncbi:uncharacterized protein LOC110275732 [Arachis duranensis]|uniref:Uncharacterized protein LOC110275732 n=1 Tax=Arachis duranensis TaxID=130453 RepID=A0A6P5MSS7_ARADU|nr:uncharacterized protein LOC110275732 [Arachis duranensis]